MTDVYFRGDYAEVDIKGSVHDESIDGLTATVVPDPSS